MNPWILLWILRAMSLGIVLIMLLLWLADVREQYGRKAAACAAVAAFVLCAGLALVATYFILHSHLTP